MTDSDGVLREELAGAVTEMVSKMFCLFLRNSTLTEGRTEALKVLGEGLTWNPRH